MCIIVLQRVMNVLQQRYGVLNWHRQYTRHLWHAHRSLQYREPIHSVLRVFRCARLCGSRERPGHLPRRMARWRLPACPDRSPWGWLAIARHGPGPRYLYEHSWQRECRHCANASMLWPERSSAGPRAVDCIHADTCPGNMTCNQPHPEDETDPQLLWVGPERTRNGPSLSCTLSST